jgi:transposase
MLDAGNSYQEIQRRLSCDATYISRWKKRFLESRIAGLYGRHRGSRAQVLTPKMEARIIAATGRKPPDGSTHWSTLKLAKHLGVSHVLVARVWKRARLQPHRIERYMMSNDVDFERKAADIIALYVNPP